MRSHVDRRHTSRCVRTRGRDPARRDRSCARRTRAGLGRGEKASLTLINFMMPGHEHTERRSFTFALKEIAVPDAGSLTRNQADALIRRYFEEVWNQGRLDVLDDIIDPEYINHSPGIPNPRPGPADL